MDKIELANCLTPRHLELIVLPTEQCNFRCTYCYEDFEIGNMKPNKVEAIKKLILSRLPNLSSLSLSWFGGEPLMAKNTVFDLGEFAQRECAARGVYYRSEMTSNAFGMDSKTFEALLNLNVTTYQISLDGDENEHNKTRKLMSGRGTFQKIWENLLAMRANPHTFRIRLRVHVHKENLASVNDLLRKINDAFGDDPRFSIFLKPVGNWGGESVKQMELVKDPKTCIAELNALLQEIGWFAARQTATSDAPPPVKPCYAAKPNSFVIRANGNLAKCTVAFNDERNDIGHINDDGTLHIASEKVKTFMRGFQTMDEKSLHCPMHGMPKLEDVKVIKFEKKLVLEPDAALPA